MTIFVLCFFFSWCKCLWVSQMYLPAMYMRFAHFNIKTGYQQNFQTFARSLIVHANKEQPKSATLTLKCRHNVASLAFDSVVSKFFCVCDMNCAASCHIERTLYITWLIACGSRWAIL
uniref:Putative secreted protein n=1 Tax=Rhipicephalus microplus TaxID=6941 RepID=A0A6M2D9C0_RHIMP